MSEFLEVRSLKRTFLSGDRTLEILRDLFLTVERGCMLAVTGASGSGKSTLLHLLGAMDRPDGGSIQVAGVEVTRLTGFERARFRNRQVGFVFQFHHLLPEFSALENVMFPLLLGGTSFREAAREALTLLGEVGLESRAQHRPGELSGGEQQRVAVARALVGRPKLLLADEPTGNLDEATAASVFKLLRQVHEKYRLTSILVTHNPQLASRCDRVRRLQEGRLIEP